MKVQMGPVTISTRGKPHNSEIWGRFGGGWQWKVGFQASKGFRDVLFNLLVTEIQISFGRPG